MGERILVVSPYPPVRDGIGAYAVQQVRALRRAGNDVEVLSPFPSAAHHHRNLVGPAGARALASVARGFDRVIVHFHPDVFYPVPAAPSARLTTGLALARALRSMPPTEIVLHEVDRRWAVTDEAVEAARRTGPAVRLGLEAASRATRAVFGAASRISVHVPEHQRMLVEDFDVPADRVRLVDHGADFEARVRNDRAAARRALGIADAGHVFVCIGFIQPHKGFDRAAVAFRGLGERGASLHVVGSVRVDDPAADEHRRTLEALAAQTPGLELHLGYVSDDAFDRWIVAADTVVLPYRHIWSSGVAERARLYGRPVIATRVGGLQDQLADLPGSVLVDDNRALAAAMAAAVAASAGAADPTAQAESTPWDLPEVTRDAVMAEVHRRAAAQRGVKLTATASDGGALSRPARSGSVATPLRRLRPVPPPPATSARPGVSTIKRLIRRLIAWEVDPLRDQLGRLQQASVQAAETADARIEQVTPQDR